jgi:hypothetical protein
MTYCDVQLVRAHNLLKIDATRFIDCSASAPEWAMENLQRTPFVVVRRHRAFERFQSVNQTKLMAGW